jgi:transglutaminase-like putative cysteine protease
MKRREFVVTAGMATTGLMLGGGKRLRAADAAAHRAAEAAAWRTFEITVKIEVLKPVGTTRIWMPAALLNETPYQKTLGNTFAAGEGGTAKLLTPFVGEPGSDVVGIVSAEFPEGVKPGLTVTSRISTRNVAVDLSSVNAKSKGIEGSHGKERKSDLAHFLRPTKLIPTDGVVKSTAAQITANAKTDVDKARAIYEWIVDNTFRNPKTRGCGTGDIRSMLEMKDLGGKCADLNALFVGLARASGLPARDVYGIRVAKSELGYKSLGANTEVITKSQHCRAEVYLTGHGWTPVDPADVRKVVLEEPPGNRPLDDEMVKAARARLFGSWEMNWMAYNFAHDVELPGSNGKPLGFLMYPQAETADGRLDCLDPDNFKYTITSAEVV